MSVMFEILQRLEKDQGEVSANFTLDAVSLIPDPPSGESRGPAKRRGPKRAAAPTGRPLPIAPALAPSTRIDWNKAIDAGKASLNFWGEPRLRPGWMSQTACLRRESSKGEAPDAEVCATSL